VVASGLFAGILSGGQWPFYCNFKWWPVAFLLELYVVASGLFAGIFKPVLRIHDILG
jgi:hypothetical protein